MPRCSSTRADAEAGGFGQDKAIEALSASIKLARAGLREPEKPIGSYLFSGPTGVARRGGGNNWRNRSA